MSYLDQKLYVQNSGNAWSYQNTGDVARFEVHAGDKWAQDGTQAKERSEVATSEKLAFGKEYDVSFSLMIEPGAKNTAEWMTLVQIQSTFDAGEAGHSPAFAIEMVGDRMRIVTRDSSQLLSTAADTHYVRQYTDVADVSRGVWYDFKIHVTLDAFGGGALDVTRNGVNLVNYHGAVGFNDLVGSYLKLGVYRAAASETIAVNYRDVDVALHDAAPVITSNGGGAKAAVTVAENTNFVTTVLAADPEGKHPTYSIVDGADRARFAIDPETGRLSFVNAPDREAPTDVGGDNIYNVTVRASDGLKTVDQALAVTVTNVNDSSPVITSNGGGRQAAVTVTENKEFVTTVLAVDPDGTRPTYSLVDGADLARFAIDPVTGQLSFLKAPNWEAPTDAGGDNIYNVTVRASDGVHVVDQALAITVANAAERSVPTANSVTPQHTQYFDKNWVTTGGKDTTTVIRLEGDKTVVETWAGKQMLSASVESQRDGKTVVEFFDGHWKAAGGQITTFGEKTVTEYFDSAWKTVSASVLSMKDGHAVEQHYDALWHFLGADVGIKNNGKSVIEHYGADWHLTGADVLQTKAGQLTTEHFDNQWHLTSAEVSGAPPAAAVLHVPLTEWLLF